MALAPVPADAKKSRVPRAWMPAVAAVVLVLLAYARVPWADFNWDDDAHITANPTIVGPLGLKEIWTSGKANYFPLTMTSFWVQHALWGLSPGAYHVVTVLFHAAGVVMLWLILRRLRVPGAWLGAMLWGLHPVQVESVAWICELKNTQSGFFFLLSVWFFLRWLGVGRVFDPPLERGHVVEGGSQTRPTRNANYVLAIVAAILAILSKSSTVMLPVVLGAIGWSVGHRNWREARWLLPFFAVSLLASGWTIWEQKVNSMASGPDWEHGLASRLIIAGKVPWFYLGKLLWPDLVFIYPRWDVNAFGVLHWLPLLATVALGGALLRWRDTRGRPVFIALTCFFVSLVPVLGLFDVFFFKYSFVADHFQYLASMGPLALIGAGIWSFAERFGMAAGRIRHAIGAALLGVLGVLSFVETGHYLTRETLWRQTVAENPNAWIARMNLGAELLTTGRSAQALPHFEAAARLRTNDGLSEMNWGAALINLGRIADAVPHLERSVRFMPELTEAHSALGLALLELGRVEEAIARGETAVRLNPQHANARYNLGNTLEKAGRPAEALPHFEAAAQLAPHGAMYVSKVGQMLARLGQPDAALEKFRVALALDPRDFAAARGSAEILAARGAHQSALEHAAVALSVWPDAAEVRFLVGNLLMHLGRPADAVAHYEHALRVRPDFADARGNLGAAYYRAGRPADALPHFEALARANPNSAGAQNNLGSALMQTARLPEAIERFRRAIELEPGYLEARANLALCFEASGQRDRALDEYEGILRRSPQHAGAQEKLRQLRAAHRRPKP